MRRLGRGVWIGLGLLVLSGAAWPGDRTPRPASALIAGVPHIRQEPDFCGEACVEMVLRKLGKRGDQNYVFNMSGLDPAAKVAAVTRPI